MATRRQRRVTRARDDEAAGAFSSPACYLHEFEAAATGPASTRRSARAPACGVGIKRIYDAPEVTDGYRVLIDRLWPRGISKKRAALDAWLTDLAPSTALRTWFHHDPKRWREFARRYRAELWAQAPVLQTLRQRAGRQRVTLLYAARDARVNQATVLREVMLQRATRAAQHRAGVHTRSATRGRTLSRTRARSRP
jgi:uncharacterized protein YeaO (DUF488 family)